MKIHPTAVVHPDAVLGEGVEIGPFAVIEGAAQIGAHSVIQAHAVITGAVTMGPGNVVGYGSVLGSEPQDLAFQPGMRSDVRIGERNRFREFCTIHRGAAEGSSTIVGDDCFLMAGAHLGHNSRIGNGVVIANNSLLGGYVEVGDRVFIGGACVFHQRTHVGRLAITQGKGGFSKDIPPFTVGAETNGVAGLNIVGLRRAGFSPEQRIEIKRAFELLYRRGLNVSQALEEAKKSAWGSGAQDFFAFVAAAGKRGICDWIGSRGSAGASRPAAEEA